jgi:hypothetical protein
MGKSRIACSIILLLWAGNATAQNQATINVQQIADTMVRLCIAGGSAPYGSWDRRSGYFTAVTRR